MKPWPLLIGIIVILSIICSPVLAISKSELIAQYRTTPVSPAYPYNNADNPEFFFIPGHLPFPNDMLPFPKWAFNGSSESPIFSAGKKSLIFSHTFEQPFWVDDIPVKKPNIYLYSERDLTARVRLAPERAITSSEPAYQAGMGWVANIQDGSLNGNGDFLFYEAFVPDHGWQKNEGYVIRTEHRSEDMASMLVQYGFNEKETGDFIGYWEQQLEEDVNYVFYPQETGTVDRVMQLHISPEPDGISRIWFYAEPMVSAPEPVRSPEKIVRDGFYVVEWGVIIDDDYRI